MRANLNSFSGIIECDGQSWIAFSTRVGKGCSSLLWKIAQPNHLPDAAKTDSQTRLKRGRSVTVSRPKDYLAATLFLRSILKGLYLRRSALSWGVGESTRTVMS